MRNVYKKFVGVVLGTLLIGVLVSACGSSDSGSDEAGGGKPGSGYTVGAVSFLNADLPSAAIANAYVDALKERGFDVSEVDAQGSPGTAVQAMQNFVQKGVDLIWVQLWEAKQVQAGLRAAQAAGIPVVASAPDLGGDDGYRSTINIGPASGEALAQYIADSTKGAGDMLVIGYSPGWQARTREEALNETLSGMPEINTDRVELNVTDINGFTTNAVNAWLGEHPKGSSENLMIWTPSSCCASAAVTALRQAGRDDVKLYSFLDATESLVRLVEQGWLTAVAADDVVNASQQMADDTPGIIEAGVDGAQNEIEPDVYVMDSKDISQTLNQNPDLLATGQ